MLTTIRSATRPVVAVALATLVGGLAGQALPEPVSQPLFAEFGKMSIPKRPGFDGAFAVRLFDADDDGDLDLVMGGGGTIPGPRLFLNDGHGAFSEVTVSHIAQPLRVLTYDIATGDVDGDGRTDFVLANDANAGPGSRLFLNTGGGQFTDVSTKSLPLWVWNSSYCFGVSLADMDDDGDLDLVLCDAQGRGRLTLLLNDGRGVFNDASRYVPNPQIPLLPQAPFWGVDVGDVDADGSPDIVVARGGGIALFVNDGHGWFTDASGGLPAMTLTHVRVQLGDVDGDRDLDLVATNFYGKLALFRNDGKGRFADATATHLPSGAPTNQLGYEPILADLDHDGDLDLYVATSAGSFDGKDHVLMNDGTGHYVDATERFIGWRPDGATLGGDVGDVDGDGDLDIVLPDGCGGDHKLCYTRLYVNRTRQLYAPGTPRIGFPHTWDVHAQPGSVALTWIATAETGGVRIEPFGVFRLPPAASALVSMAAVGRSGVATSTLPIPADPSLVGQRACLQALVFDPAVPSNSRFTGAITDRIR